MLSVSVCSLFSSVKRFVSNAWKKKIYLEENINALVKMSENKYRVMKMKQQQKILIKKRQNIFVIGTMLT